MDKLAVTEELMPARGFISRSLFSSHVLKVTSLQTSSLLFLETAPQAADPWVVTQLIGLSHHHLGICSTESGPVASGGRGVGSPQTPWFSASTSTVLLSPAGTKSNIRMRWWCPKHCITHDLVDLPVVIRL